jgi:hypothetical protein
VDFSGETKGEVVSFWRDLGILAMFIAKIEKTATAEDGRAFLIHLIG